jgi:maltose alpha-D-glucosyltransferase/alpha-amylase
MLLAEANQRVEGLLPYFGAGDECRGAFHFPLMPRFWQAMSKESPQPLLSAAVPPLPDRCAWYTFVRVHDEVTLDVIPLEERRALVAAFAGKPERIFRQGEAFAGRLFDLLGGDADRVILAFHLLFSLGGTPVVYYGDEIGMRENRAYYEETAARTGYPDARFLHRGPFDAARLARAETDAASSEGRILRAVRELLRLRSAESAFFAESPTLTADGPVLVSTRRDGERKLTCRANLANREALAGGRRLRPFQASWSID